MKKTGLALGAILLAAFLVFTFPTVTRNNIELIDESEIQLNIMNRVRTFKNYSSVKAITIEKSELISGTRVILYSVNNPPFGVKTYGLATYEAMKNGKLKRKSLMVTNDDLSLEHINLVSGTPYLLVFGSNVDNKTQVYKHTLGDKEEIVEFCGEYFLVKFPGNVRNTFLPVDDKDSI